MNILSINIAPVGSLFVNQADDAPHRIESAIHKQAVSGPVLVKRLGLVGDAQADRGSHGGPDKAVYAYPFEHYAFWKMQRLQVFKRDQPLLPGAMGENLTLQGLLEEDVWIGDRLAIGSAVLQVTEPRTPCFKFGVKMGFSHAPKLMIQSGASGFYMRVVQEGIVQAGDEITLIPGPRRLSIMQINDQHRKGSQYDLF